MIRTESLSDIIENFCRNQFDDLLGEHPRKITVSITSPTMDSEDFRIKIVRDDLPFSCRSFYDKAYQRGAILGFILGLLTVAIFWVFR